MSDDAHLDGETLESKLVISAEELERIREVQRNSIGTKGKNSHRGIGMLLEVYINSKGYSRERYLSEESEYIQREGLNVNTVRSWFKGNTPFRLKHLKGLVDELGVSDEHLHYVASRDPFEPTEGELEEWSKDEKKFRRLFIFYAGLRYGLSAKGFICEASNYVKKEGLRSLSVHTSWVQGLAPFPLKHLKGLVNELKIPDDVLKKVCGRDPFTPTEEELKSWSEDNRGLRYLFKFYTSLKHGMLPPVYFREHSEYVQSEELNWGTVCGVWSYGQSIPPQHLKGLANELEIPPDYVQRVTGVDIGEVVVSEVRELSREEKLEEMRRVQEDSRCSEGVGMLLELYIEEIGHSRRGYFTNHSEYVKKEGLTSITVCNWIAGRYKFPLKHMKGIVEELEVDQDELEYVAGMNPFELTEEDLERWSGDNKGLKELFAFYINLNHGLMLVPYLRDKSEYSKVVSPSISAITNYIYKKNMPPQHLRGLVDEIGVPHDQVKRVCGVDVSEVVTAKDELNTALVGYLRR